MAPRFGTLLAALGFALTATAASVAGCSSKPVYPACRSDEGCAADARHDYCVAGRCVQCRTAIDCGDRERCREGRCESDPDAPPVVVPVEAGPDVEEHEDPRPVKRPRRYYEE